MRKSLKAARVAKLAASTNVPAVIADETATEAVTVTGTDIATIHADGALVIDGATGETVAPETNDDTTSDDNTADDAGNSETPSDTATEAKPDQSAARKAVIAANRAAVSELYAGFNSVAVSVPIKALSAFKPSAATPHANARKPSIRQSAAIATMLAASGNKLADGATFPRIAEIDGVTFAIENGCAADMLRAGLVSVAGDNPADEIFTVLPKQAAIVVSHLSGKLLRKAGVLA